MEISRFPTGRIYRKAGIKNYFVILDEKDEKGRGQVRRQGIILITRHREIIAACEKMKAGKVMDEKYGVLKEKEKKEVEKMIEDLGDDFKRMAAKTLLAAY